MKDWMVWMDYESHMGRGTKASQDQDKGGRRRKELKQEPCVKCEGNGFCSKVKASCQAFREYEETGNYSDEHIARKLRSLDN